MYKFLLVFLIGLPASSFASSQIYEGASFKEVWQVIEDQGFTPQTKIEQKEFAVYQSSKLPQYPVTMSSLFANGDSELRRDAVRTTTERFDYYDRLPKKLHPNGVCVSGVWNITKATKYTGMLATSSKGLFIGRVSVAMGDTLAGEDRGFGIAGKVFPTLNENEVVATGNFFTVDVLTGTKLDKALNAKTTNEPEAGFKLSLIGLGLKIGAALSSADNNPGFRPLTQVASAGAEAGAVLSQPKWIRLRVPREIKRNKQDDFRNEILTAVNENSGLKYLIEVSNETKDRNASSGWVEIGEIIVDQAVVSYGCDRRLHFSHPKLK
jgi:hypothetical protein